MQAHREDEVRRDFLVSSRPPHPSTVFAMGRALGNRPEGQFASIAAPLVRLMSLRGIVATMFVILKGGDCRLSSASNEG